MSNYRVPFDERVKCPRHPLSEVTEACHRCGAAVCDDCAAFSGRGVSCSGCAAAVRRGQAGKIAAALGLLAVLALFAATRPGAPAPVPGGALSPAPPSAKDCDDAAAAQAVGRLLASGDRAAALDQAGRYERDCKASPALFYRAAMDAGDSEVAVSQATRFIEADPTNAVAWASRGRAHGKAGRLEAAALDYRQALALRRADVSYADEAAVTLEALGRPCEASLVLADLLRTNYMPATKQPFIARARRLWASPGCGEIGGSGAAELRLSEDDHWRGEAAVGLAGGAASRGTFLFHQGAHHPVIVTRSFAARAGLGVTDTRFWVPTPWGVLQGHLATEDAVRIQRAVARHLVVVVVDELPADAALAGLDGVLGLDLLRRFHQELEDPDPPTPRKKPRVLRLTALRSWAELSREGPLDDIDDVNANGARQWERIKQEEEDEAP